MVTKQTAKQKKRVPERQPLSREAIVAAAVAIADQDDVAGLSMRNLAGSLGYEVMSLYNHVANKNELLALMVDAVAAEIGGPEPDLAPLEAIRALAVSTRATLLRHPWAPPIWQRHFPGPARVANMEDLLRIFGESGLSPELAHHGFHAVNNHVLGYTMQELQIDSAMEGLEETLDEFLSGSVAAASPHVVAHIHQHLDGETSSSFELVLDLILDGLVRLDEGQHRQGH